MRILATLLLLTAIATANAAPKTHNVVLIVSDGLRWQEIFTGADHFVEELWRTLEALPAYHDQTTYIITTDHGRGSGPTDWKEHGTGQPGSENIWIAVLGPDTRPLGERTQGEVTQAQIAATVAALLGKDYRHAVPTAAAPIAEVLGPTPN